MKQNRHAVAFDVAHDAICRVQYLAHVHQPLRRRHVAIQRRLTAIILIQARTLTRFDELCETIAHDVNVANVAELERAARIRLVAAALQAIGVGVDLGSRIDDMQWRRRSTATIDRSNEALVVATLRAANANKRLRAARNRCASFAVLILSTTGATKTIRRNDNVENLLIQTNKN